MKLNQLSVFLENKPGRLRELCALLAEHQINMITLSLADTKEFGILRMIVNEPETAQTLLKKEGFVAKLTEVIAVEVKDEPGGLLEILQVEEAAGISVEYTYAFTVKKGKHAVLILRFDDTDKAATALQDAGFNVLDRVSVFKRAQG